MQYDRHNDRKPFVTPKIQAPFASTDAAIRDRLLAMDTEYAKALIRHVGGYTRGELKKLNRIDVRELFDVTTDDHSYGNMKKEYTEDSEINSISNRETYYASIPCFSEGVFQVNTSRYLHWQTYGLAQNPPSHCVKVASYGFWDGLWTVDSVVHIAYRYLPDEDRVISKPETELNPWGHSRVLDASSLPQWTKNDWEFWNSVAIPIEDSTDAKLVSDKRMSGKYIADLFTCLTLVTNILLARNKASSVKKTSKANISHTVEPSPPARSMRTVGPITICSDRPPRAPSQISSVTYKTPSWKTRGHIRTYRSGKQVYIKEKTHHRQCMKQDSPAPPVTMKLKGNPAPGGKV